MGFFKKILGSNKAMIWGWKGQDGSLLAKSLLNQGFNVIGISRPGTYKFDKRKHIELEKYISKEIGDVNDFKFVDEIIKKHEPNEIYNLAAQSSVGLSFREPITTFQSIVNGSLNILNSAQKTNYKGKIFFAGSSEMFGETQKAARINHVQNPVSPYGIAKQASFNLVRLYREVFNLNCVTGVLFNHESPLRDNKFVTHKIITEAIECTKDTSHRLKLGNLEIIRDWGWAEEYVEAMQKMIRAKQLKDYVVCTGKPTKLESFVEKTFQKLNLNWREYVIQDKGLFRKKEIMKSYGDPSEIKNDLKWSSKIHLDDIVDKLIKSKIDYS